MKECKDEYDCVECFKPVVHGMAKEQFTYCDIIQ